MRGFILGRRGGRVLGGGFWEGGVGFGDGDGGLGVGRIGVGFVDGGSMS